MHFGKTLQIAIDEEEDSVDNTPHYLNFPDPPSPPQIHGDLRAEQRSGDKVKLTCITDGGNPLPDLTWLRNGLPLKEKSLLDLNGKKNHKWRLPRLSGN